MPVQRVLIACHNVTWSGGLLRFERVGKVLREWGCEVAFVALANTSGLNRPSSFPILNLKQAAMLRWDAVMIPGSGFPEETITNFAVFQKDNFGIRVQHILNDQSRRTDFLKVNRAFNPHVVIFNNTSWEPGSFTEFKADKFFTLVGAVDTRVFNIDRPSFDFDVAIKWTIGSQANKNPEPLIRALENLPPFVSLRMFGEDTHQLANKYRNLVHSGRLTLVGVLPSDDAMSSFYKNVDCVVMTENFAGWANMVAEAFASGVPVVCTSHGTAAFAMHESTALVMDHATPHSIALEVNRLINDGELRSLLTKRAREVIESFTWENYTERLLDLIRHDGVQHYAYAPEFNLHGKWSLSGRLDGLAPLLSEAREMEIADFGAAEGLVAYEFLKHGALKVVGFELDPDRVVKANELCSPFDAQFIAADLSDWKHFWLYHGTRLNDGFDIVLYLGIQHHLPPRKRLETLSGAASLARKFFAVRTTPAIYEEDQIDFILQSKGFRLSSSSRERDEQDYLGHVKIYVRQGQ